MIGHVFFKDGTIKAIECALIKETYIIISISVEDKIIYKYEINNQQVYSYDGEITLYADFTIYDTVPVWTPVVGISAISISGAYFYMKENKL